MIFLNRKISFTDVYMRIELEYLKLQKFLIVENFKKKYC